MAAEEGKAAPAFSLDASTGKKIALKDFKGKKAVVLYFYPKDDTPGCTTEACDFRDSSARIKRLGAVILGVSPDGVAKHEKFIGKHDLNFPLLADEDNKACQAYGVWKEKSMYGRKYMGVERTTFVIDKKGTIQKIFLKVEVPQHPEAVLDFVKKLD